MSAKVIQRAGVRAEGASPVVAEVEGLRLVLRARELRGSMTLVEAARRAGMNRDELARLERGDTKQVRFATLAKLIVAYECTLEDLVDVQREPSGTPLYASALEAITDGVLQRLPRRRAVRRDLAADVIADGDEEAFAPSVAASHRRRGPAGTAHP